MFVKIVQVELVRYKLLDQKFKEVKTREFDVLLVNNQVVQHPRF